MFVLDSKIEIGGKSFGRVHEVRIKKNVKQIQNTGVIKIPATARMQRAGKLISEVETAKTFAVGDEVKIWLGYNGSLREEFQGFVSKIKPQIPVEIEIENEAFILKRKSINQSFFDTTLRKVLEYVLAGTGISMIEDVPDLAFDSFYLIDVSAAKALQKISKEYGLRMYFKSWKVLFVGLVNENNDLLVKYKFGYNVISNSLEWLDKDDVKLKIKAISVRPDNSRIEVETGDPGGDKRTLWFYNLASKKELEIKAKAEIEKYKYSGYKGSIKTFLLPNCEVGNIASIQDDDFPERSGNYLVNGVETIFGENGARRNVEIGIKVNV